LGRAGIRRHETEVKCLVVNLLTADDFATIKARMEELRHRRAADDFASIRARMEELRRERDGNKPGEKEAQGDPPIRRGGAIRWPASETSEGLGRVRQSGPIRG